MTNVTVEEAERPLVSNRSVEVELAVEPKLVVVVNGKENVAMLESTLALVTVAQVVAPRAERAVTNWLVQAAAPPYSAKTPPAPVRMRAEVMVSMSSWPEMLRLVVVALVEVALVVTRLVMVEDAALTKIPPVKERRVEVAAFGNR